MRALRAFGVHDLRVIEWPEPEPGPGEVKVAVRASGLCGSDKWYWTSGPSDVIAGHEVAGQVAALGPGVTRLRIGDRVAINNVVGCGACDACREGRFVRCEFRPGRDVDRGFSEVVTAPERNCLLLDDAIGFVAGCLIFDNWGTPYAALERGGIAHQDTVIITGSGPIGLGAVVLAKLRGATVIVVDPVPYRRTAALRLGADHAIPPGDGAVQSIRTLAHGGASAAIECSGRGEAYELALAALGTEGRLVCVGEHAEYLLRPSDRLIRRNLAILGSWYSTMEQGVGIQRLILQRAIDPLAFVTHQIPLEDAPVAFDRAVNMRDDTLKTVILMP